MLMKVISGNINSFLWVLFGLFSGLFQVHAQIKTQAEAFFNPSINSLSINQSIEYTNNSGDTLDYIYLNDWANAFKSKVSPLGEHFSSAYLKKFHFSKLAERGETRIDFIQDKDKQKFKWKRPEKHPDIIAIPLKKNLNPRDSVTLNLQYAIRIPKDKFTGYGVQENGDVNLRYWLIHPAVYDESWQIYSHKDLNDQFQPRGQVALSLQVPKGYKVFSDMEQMPLKNTEPDFNTIKLSGEQQNNFKLVLSKNKTVKTFETTGATVFSDIEERNVPEDIKETTVRRIMSFLNERLGSYPHKNLLVSKVDYKNSPIYGLNQLPDFIRPFFNGFQYDLKMMKTMTRNYLENSLAINPREEEWLVNAMQIYLLMDYVDEFYPGNKLIGKLSQIIGIRWSNLAKLDFNHQYQYYFMHMNRLNLDQALSKSKDSLVKFNHEIANPYKAGVGFKYLEDFLGADVVDKSIKEFYEHYKLKPVYTHDFEKILKANAPKDVDWFFKEFVQTNVRLDFTIDKVQEKGDSLRVHIKNKENNSMPISLYGLDKDKNMASKHWVEDTKGTSSITIPRKNITRLGLNHEGIIPEINKRNNYKNLRSPFNKPIQFRFLVDAEDPRYTQFFFMPEFSYNLYDGFILGSSISNQAILSKRFTYTITPQYGLKSHAFVGRFSGLYKQQFRNRNLSSINYGVSGTRFQYDYNLFYHRLSPRIRFNWRHRDLRNRERQSLTFRNVYVHRDDAPNLDLDEKPNYNVFDIRYNYSNKSLIRSFNAAIDVQYGKKFSKAALTAKYRKLFLNNRQFELRLFAGAFLHNKTDEDSDYFSFGLDRPTDYLFDYNYYGRSEGGGLFSQQFIESEGGFKAQLEPRFANQWLTSLNTSVSFWRDILYAYGDVGLLKNTNAGTKLRYDSGVRISLVQDYFEVFFPVYSNSGWEIGQKDYDKRIRFIVALDFQTLMGLFGRTYY